MKKYFILILIFSLFASIKPVFAQATINDFSADIKMNIDSSLDITETITYDFGGDEKHGIYRDIYFKYKLAKGSFKLRLSDISVVDENGQPYIFTISDQGNFKRIKIGDPNKMILGVKIYKIKYKVNRAINFFSDHDELYWNVTGSDWQLPIKQAKAEVSLPQGVLESDIKTECFAGPAASDKKCLYPRYIYSAENQVKGVSFISDILKSGEGMTFAISLPKDVIKKSSTIKTITETVKDNWIVVLPIIIFFIMYNIWTKRGRDPQGSGTIIAQFDAPDGLTPAEVGTLVDEYAQNRDISSQIIYLAVNGYLKINRIEKKGLFGSDDYELIKLKAEDGLKNEFEKKLFSSLFKDKKEKVLLADLKEKFYKDLAIIKKDIYLAMAEKGYFSANPEKVRIIYLLSGIAVLALSWLPGSLFGWLGIVSFAVSGALIILFSFFMPKKTIKGVSAKEYILGLKLYLKVAEQDRINFHNAPEKNPQLFEKLLPYAMVLGVEKQWAKKFEGIYNTQPGWYNDPSGSYFSALLLTNSLGNFSTQANSAIASVPSSAAGGGSGFSGGGVGGGFGGGGGGSW